MKQQLTPVLPGPDPLNTFTLKLAEAFASIVRFFKGLSRDGEAFVFSGTVQAPLQDVGGAYFSVLAGGAKNDGVEVFDAACTAGSKIVTSATAAFTRADVGKPVFLGGTSLNIFSALQATIQSVDSATQVHLSANAPFSGTAQRMAYGTDNTAALQAVLDTYPRVFFPTGLYVIRNSVRPSSNARLEGAGSTLATLLYFPPAADTPGLYMHGVDNVRVESLGLKGYGSRGVSQTKVHFIGLSGCATVLSTDSTRVTLFAVDVDGGGTGIEFQNTLDSAAGFTYTTNYGHRVQGCRVSYTGGGCFYNFRLDDVHFIDCHAEGAGSDGFKFQTLSRRMRITGCSSRNNGRDGMDCYDGFVESVLDNFVSSGNMFYGIEVKGTFDVTLSDYVVRESAFNNIMSVDNGDVGIELSSVHNATFSNLMSLRNCATPFDPTQIPAGIRFNNCRNLTVGPVTASRNHGHGISFELTTAVVMTSVLAVDNSYVDGVVQNGTYHGVYFDERSGGNVISGLQAGNSVAVGTVQRSGGQGYAVWFNDDGTFFAQRNQVVGASAATCLTGTANTAGLARNYVSDSTGHAVDVSNHVSLYYTGTQRVAGANGGAVTAVPRWADPPVSIPANDATPTITSGNAFYTQNTAPTLIGQPVGGIEGQEIEIMAGDSNTSIANNAFIVTLTGATRVLALNETITLRMKGTLWYEVGLTAARVAVGGVVGGSAGQVIRSNGTGGAWSTATYPDTVAAGDLVTATAANVVGRLTIGATNTVLTSSGTASQWSTSLVLAGSLSVATTAAVTGTSTLTGNVGVGVAPMTSVGLNVRPGALSGATQTGAGVVPTWLTGATTEMIGVSVTGSSTAGVYTTTNMRLLKLAAPTRGANHSITTLAGLYVEDLTGVTAGTRWAVQTAGTTPCSFGGNVAVAGTGSYGGGAGCLSLVNAVTAPTSNPTGAAVVYTDPADNKVKARTPNGVTTTLAA